jgi:hypothetical protein
LADHGFGGTVRHRLTGLWAGSTTERGSRKKIIVVRTVAKPLAAALGLGAVVVALVIGVDARDGTQAHSVAGGSGDSATGTSYVQPTVPVMSIDPTNMSMGATVTATAPTTALATAMASPTFKASPEPGCVNNGQCP